MAVYNLTYLVKRKAEEARKNKKPRLGSISNRAAGGLIVLSD